MAGQAFRKISIPEYYSYSRGTEICMDVPFQVLGPSLKLHNHVAVALKSANRMRPQALDQETPT